MSKFTATDQLCGAYVKQITAIVLNSSQKHYSINHRSLKQAAKIRSIFPRGKAFTRLHMIQRKVDGVINCP